MPNYVCLTPWLPGNRALWRRMKRQRAHIFHTSGIPQAPGTHPSFSPFFLPLSSVSPNSHHFQRAASLPADLKTGQRRSNAGKVRGKGGLRGSTCLCLLHPGFSRETDWRSISLPVRGKAFSQEGSDIINPL